MTQTALFPTLIHRAHLGDAALLSELEASVWMLEEGDSAGHDWCEANGYPGYTSYASLDDLPDRAPAFAGLLERLQAEAAAFSKALHWDLDGRELVLSGMWVNVLGEGMGHSGHIHPGCVISGTCYVAMPDGAGALKLEDPRLTQMMAAPQLAQDAPEEMRRFVYLRPQAGEIILWESWLRHEVMASGCEDPRISISFNLALV